MPLTPEDVRNKVFTAVRLREGYDVNEVDDFLDEVVAELERLLADNDDLRAKLEACEQRVATAPAAKVPVAPPPPPPPVPTPAPPPTPVAAPMGGVGMGVGGVGGADAAARLLQLAQKTHDDLVADARAQADKILAEARAKGDQLVGEARTRAERIDREAQERQRQTIGNLEQRKDELERKVEELRAFEREYRTRLKSYLESQLRQLEGPDDGDRPAASAGRAMSGTGYAETPYRSEHGHR
jgi:DivIVA domain-containing protein